MHRALRRLFPRRSHVIKMTDGHVREYVKRVASVDLDQYPEWDVTKPLPKLPVPDLHSSLDTYLAIMKSVVSPEQYRQTKILVEDFKKHKGQGEMLQDKLKKYAETRDNWVYSWWLDDMYMNARLALPINSNPGMVFPRQNFRDRSDQLRYAARLVAGILDYKTIIDARGLPVDRCRHKEKGQPLCMAQYYRLFTSYRAPGVNKDCLLEQKAKLIPDPDHVIVICKHQLFALQVVNNYHQRLSEDDIFTQLERIYTMADEGQITAESVGIFTAASRDKWAKIRIQLLEEPVNRESLDTIERCVFILSLDEAIPISFNHQRSIDETSINMRDDVSLILQMLHGHGTKSNTCNRWFDKTMQFIISADGACGLNYEHSASEGIAVVQLIEHLLKYMQEVHERKLRRLQSLSELPYPRKLQWVISDDVRTEMRTIKQDIDSLIDDLDLYVLRFNEFGRDFPKKHNMSPDSFIQLALQLTYYKIHGKLVSTYESASTRRFQYGRVDNIRANSPAALEWVEAMTGKTEVSNAEKLLLLRKAMDWQTHIMTKTILGHGVDCHLLGLREIANELGLPVPDVFTDETYKMSNHFTLSTSQVPTTMDAFMCYGPVVPDGYGVCYNPHQNNIVVCIAAFQSHAETQSDYFALTLEGSFLQMAELCRKEKEDAEADVMKLRNCNVNVRNTNDNSCDDASRQGKPLSRQKQSNGIQGNGHVKQDSTK